MLRLVTDANVLIDIEVGGLVGSLFSLGYEILVADVLFEEELDDQHSDLRTMGLRVTSLSPEGVSRVQKLAGQCQRVSRNDLFGLALAEREGCLLLTGDAALRALAESEGVVVHGTLWVVEEMIRNDLITPGVAHAAYETMRAAGRRLPWDQAHQRIDDLVGKVGFAR